MAAALRLLGTDWQPVHRDETDSVVSVTSAASPTTQVFEEVLRVVGQVVEYADRADDAHSCSGVSVKTTPRSSQALDLGDFGLGLGLGIFARSAGVASRGEASDAAACTGDASWSAGPCATSEEIGDVLRRLADNVQALDLVLTAPSQASEFDSQTLTSVAAREAVASHAAPDQALSAPAAAAAAADPSSSSAVVAALSLLATGLRDSPPSAVEPSPASVVEALARGSLEEPPASPVSPTAALDQLVRSFEAQNGGAADGEAAALDSLVKGHEEAATAPSAGEVAPPAMPPVAPEAHTAAPEALQPVSLGDTCAATAGGPDGSPRELDTGMEAPALPVAVAEPSPVSGEEEAPAPPPPTAVEACPVMVEAPAPPADAPNRCPPAPEEPPPALAVVPESGAASLDPPSRVHQDVAPGGLSLSALEVLVRGLQEEVAALRESEQARLEEMRALRVSETSRVEGSLRELLEVRLGEQERASAEVADVSARASRAAAEVAQDARAEVSRLAAEVADLRQSLEVRTGEQAGLVARLGDLEVTVAAGQAALTEGLRTVEALLEEGVVITERMAAVQVDSADVHRAAADKLEAAINTTASNREEAQARHADVQQFVDSSLAKLGMKVEEEAESLRAEIHLMGEELRADLWREAVTGRQHQAQPAAPCPPTSPADWQVELHRLASQVASERAHIEGRMGGIEARLCDLRRDVYERLAAEAAERTGGYDVIAGQVQRSALREELDKRLASLRQELACALVAPAGGGNGAAQRWASGSSPGRPGAGCGAPEAGDAVAEVMEQSIAGLRSFKSRLQEDEHRPMEEVISHLVAGVLKMAQFLGVASEDVCEKLSWRDACCDLPRMMDHAWLRCRLPKRASLLKVVRQKADAEQVSRQQQQLDTLLATLAVGGGSLCPTPSSFCAPAPAGLSRPPGSPHMWSHGGCGSPSPASRPLSAATTAWSPDDDAPTRPPSAPPSRRRPGPPAFGALPRWGAAAANAAEPVQA